MTIRTVHTVTLALATVGAALLSACACPQPAGGNNRPPPPPAEALAACKATTAGSACSIRTPSGEIGGSCWAPEGKPLACKPTHPPSAAAPASSGPATTR
jgi:hypothetical protein